jgi:hypothetical protein
MGVGVGTELMLSPEVGVFEDAAASASVEKGTPLYAV